MPVTFHPRTVTVGKRTSVRLHPHLGEFDQASLFKSKLDYEAPVFAWLEDNAPSRYEAIVEIGANVGLYSVFFDALIKQNSECCLRRVYAFEPSSEAFLRLLANVKANGAHFVTPFAVAVSDTTGFLAFHEPDGHLTNGSLSPGFASQYSPSVRSTTTVALDGAALTQLFEQHKRVLLKIDAESHEPHILRAMESIVTQHAPDILVEVLPSIDKELNALRTLAPYRKFLMTPQGLSRRSDLRADPLNRDWLLTRFDDRLATI